MNSEQKQRAAGILLTDQYQLTMAQLYVRLGVHEKRVQFDHFFRRYPDYGEHRAGYCINAGLADLLDWMAAARFREEDLACLRDHRGPDGKRVFDDDFLGWLAENGDFSGVDIRAIPEGRVVHPNVPLTVVRGPLAMCQILETALLNRLNYPVLVATKAARIRRSGAGGAVLEFGIRRAQGDGGIAGARAALIGGADFTSNVGASHALGFPPKGTHAHSMVQLFMALGMSELDAFRAYADRYPDNCILLLDTVDTLRSGVPNAVTVFEELRRKGHEPRGVRLDSGDLAHLAVQTALRLDAAGFEEVRIILSGDLDELVIWQIIHQIREEAPGAGADPDAVIGRLVYGVGTRLITSWGSPALAAAYKLVGVRENGEWVPSLKISESVSKTPNPGPKNAWRVYDAAGRATADLVGTDGEDPASADPLVLRHPADANKSRSLSGDEITGIEPLLVEVMRDGKPVREPPSIDEIRTRRDEDLERLDAGVKRPINPHVYHVSITPALWDLKRRVVDRARDTIGKAGDGGGRDN